MSGANGDGRSGPESHVDGGLKPLTAFDPARIGPYLLLGRLGAGGMGRVFLARSDGGRTVAVKVVHEEHASDERFRARFRREIEAAGRVAERYTAPVLDSGPDEDPPWVATGYVPGLSLEQVVRRHGTLPASSLHTLADGLLRALKDIHDAGIVHRDLKPSNVMLTVDGTRVIDFGIARAMDTSEALLTSTGMIIGSPGFMAPEQLRGNGAVPKSDVFTVGCVLTYAATGQLPFGQGATNQHAVMYRIVQEEPDLEAVENPALRSLIARCLTKDVDQRPSVEALLADPDRVGPMAAGRAWLPADVLTHIAQQTARLLDAEVRPLREEPADRATVGLRPKAEPNAEPNVGPSADVPAAEADSEPEARRDKRPRRRRTVIALPIVVVLAVGGGTVAVLQPFSGGDGDGVHALAPGSSASPTSVGSGSPGGPGGSPSQKGKGKDSGGGKSGPTEQGGENKKKSDGSSAGAGDASSGSTDSTDSVDSSDSKAGSSFGSGSSTSGSSRPAGSKAGDAPGTGGSASGSSGSSGGGSSGSSTGSAPPALKGYEIRYVNSCFGACDMPLKVSWSPVSRATRYDIHYTNKGSKYTKKNVDTVYSTSNTDYTIKGPYSGDEVCVTVRAANKYGASVWAETWCDSVAY
ncbi:protein kinase [Streptomyces brevispora]|uniref:protein kinase domain-containing protein n=1 Tax=Streptomyces brevispora TaxID=887462 RepID=UPI002E37A9C0|nr:protein kinase [Streptomyces brevispora]